MNDVNYVLIKRYIDKHYVIRVFYDNHDVVTGCSFKDKNNDVITYMWLSRFLSEIMSIDIKQVNDILNRILDNHILKLKSAQINLSL